MNALEITKKNIRTLITHVLKRMVNVESDEITALFWSFLYFFSLLCSYYILRPLRDEMGIEGGVDNLQWVFTGTFLAMLAVVPLFGYVSARLPRRRLLPIVYGFFIANILIFFVLFKIGSWQVYVARAFFIWTSVFNLFVISVFWSFMADLFTNVQARRLFGFIAAGGSAGAVAGPLITGLVAAPIGPTNLLLISTVLLIVALVCIHKLTSWSEDKIPVSVDALPVNTEHISAQDSSRALGGGLFAGIRIVFSSRYLLGICLFIWLYTTLATFLYFAQAHIIAESFDDPARRTALFAWIDLAVNVLTIFAQVFVTGRLVAWLGMPLTLALIPMLMVLGFIALGLLPLLSVLIGFQIMRRAGNYAITRPAREVLFTVVGREAKYKAKNFIDTVIYRGGDAISGWVFAGLKALGFNLSGIAFIAVPVAVLWVAIGWMLGKKQDSLRSVEIGNDK